MKINVKVERMGMGHVFHVECVGKLHPGEIAYEGTNAEGLGRRIGEEIAEKIHKQFPAALKKGAKK